MADRGATAEDISGWLTPRRALEILEAAFPDKHSALNELKERLRGGIVVAACHTTSIDGKVLKPGFLNRIGSDDWDRAYSDNDVWVSGTLIVPGGYRTSTYETAKTIRFFDVRLNPAEIAAIIAPHQGAAIKPVPAQGAAPNKGGAPRKEWWDDFWIEICRQIYDNELKIEKQADLERAMHDWVSAQDFDVGETTIKNAARKLFKAWKLGGSKT